MARGRIRRTLGTAILGVVTLVAAMVTGSGSTGAAQPPSDYYLALGDSVAFGYAPSSVVPPQWYYQPSRFRGYAENVGQSLGLRVVNAACPGETSSSFVDTSLQSNGCENSVGSETGYRDLFPLHVKYNHSQLAFAERFLDRHLAHTSLVSLNVGANDLFICQRTTPDECTGQDFADTLNVIAQNVTSILSVLRATGYTGTIAILQYYSTDYNDPIVTLGALALNQLLSQIGTAFGATMPNGFTAFQTVAAATGGDSCAAGLLVRLHTGDCDIHPSQYGHHVLAHAIQNAID